MKKLLILLSIIMLLFSVTATAEAVRQEDVKALESLIDIMSGKMADYREVIGDMKDNLEAVNTDVEALEQRIQGLNATDRFLWTKIENKSPEAIIENRVNVLKDQFDGYIARLEGDIKLLAQKVDDQSVIKTLENKIETLSDDLERFIEEEKEQQEMFTSIEDRIVKELESYARTLSQLEVYAKTMEQEFQEALQTLSENLKNAEETNVGYQELETLEKALDEAKISLNTRAKWIDISIKAVKEDLATVAANLSKENVLLKEDLDRYKTSTNQRLKWIDLTVAKNKERAETVGSDLKIVQESFDTRLDNSLWALNQRLKWVDINTGNLRASLDSTKEKIDDNRVFFEKEIRELEAALLSNQTSTNQRMKWTDISIKNLKNDVQDNTQKIQEILSDIEALESVNEEADQVSNSDFEETVASLNQRLKWMDISAANTKEQIKVLEEKIVMVQGEAKEELEEQLANLNQRLKWVDISAANTKEQIKVLEEKITTVQGEAKKELDEKMASLNQRLKWMDISSTNTKEQVAALEVLLETTKGELQSELQATIASLNTRLKWMDIASTSLREKVEKQSDQILVLEKELKAELADKIYFLNQRLKWMDIQINKVKSESASQEDMLKLKDDFDYSVSRLNNIAFEVAFSKGITNDILDKLSEINEQIALLSNSFNMILSEYVTKEILEEEIAYIYWELDEIEQMTLNLTYENQTAIENAVWSINQRLKWIDITIKKAKDERTQLAQYTKEIEERLQNDINTKVLFINKRLKWMDISITNLKETKVDEAEYTKTVTKLDADKVDKDTFGKELEGISTRFKALEQELDTFKTETMDLMAAQKKALEAKIGNNTLLIQDNSAAIEDNVKDIEALEKRIELLEAQVFPEEKQPAAFGVLIGFGLVIGLGFILSSAK